MLGVSYEKFQENIGPDFWGPDFRGTGLRGPVIYFRDAVTRPRAS